MEELIFVKSGIEYYSDEFDKFDPDSYEMQEFKEEFAKKGLI